MKVLVPLTKLHGTGNDFVLIDGRERQFKDYAALARLLCDRRMGVGADGLLLLEPCEEADVQMRIFNPDGSQAQMCGNGIRCVAAYLHDRGGPPNLRIGTLAGTMLTQTTNDGDRNSVRVSLPPPQIESAFSDSARVFVRVGNPHVVLFVDSLDAVNLASAAPEISAAIEGGANVHTVVLRNRNRLEVRHWERGVGATLSCGTGAVAAAAAAIYRGDVQSPVEVIAPGGKLTVERDRNGETWLTGEAVRVFDAAIELPEEIAGAL